MLDRKKYKYRKITFAELTLIIFVINTFYEYIVEDKSDFIKNMILIAGFFSFMCHIAQCRYKVKKLLGIFIICILTLWSGYMQGTFDLVPVVMVILLFDRLTIERFVRITFVLKKFFLFIIYGITLIQYLFSPGDIVRVWSDGAFRVSFCKENPNAMGFLFTWCIIDWLWLNYNKMNIYKWILVFILDSMMYYLTKTETMIVIHVLYLLLFLLSKNLLKKNLHSIAKIIMPGMTLFTIISAWFYLQKNSFFIWLDRTIFSYRLSYSATAMLNNLPTLFGSKMNMTYQASWGTGRIVIDNFYTFSMYQHGIIFLVLIAIAFWEIAKIKDERASIIIIIFSVQALMEVRAKNICWCMGLAMIALLFQNNFQRGEIKK